MQTTPSSSEPSRFFQLILQEDLLGGWTLIRQWGKLGQRGTLRKEVYNDLNQAQEAMVVYRDQQLKKGFNMMFVQGGNAKR